MSPTRRMLLKSIAAAALAAPAIEMDAAAEPAISGMRAEGLIALSAFDAGGDYLTSSADQIGFQLRSDGRATLTLAQCGIEGDRRATRTVELDATTARTLWQALFDWPERGEVRRSACRPILS